MIPYGRQTIDEDDIAAVVSVLKSDWLTQGPHILEFEKALAEYCGARFAVVVSNGTAALHTAYHTLHLKPGDEIITSPLTFAATTNAALWEGARPIFVDIDPTTGNLDPKLIEEKITEKTRAIVPIHFSGRPADMDSIREIADRHKLAIIEDACHALGAVYKGKKIGSSSGLVAFSFHPVKGITTGEGGAVLTNDEDVYKEMKRFASHGISKENFVRESPGAWYHEMQILGNNYRMTDMQAALGTSQLKKIDSFISRRREIARRYRAELSAGSNFELPPADTADYQSAWHLYVIRLRGKNTSRRAEVFGKLRDAGIGVQVHYIPVYLHPYYESLGYVKGLCPLAENYYEAEISLPIFPSLTDAEQDFVIRTLRIVLA